VSTVGLPTPPVTIEVGDDLGLKTRPPRASSKLPRASAPKKPPGPPGVMGGGRPVETMARQIMMLVHMFLDLMNPRPVKLVMGL
jgi:hypothetical protein